MVAPKNIIKCLYSGSILSGSGSNYLPHEGVSGKFTPNLIKKLVSSDWKV